MKSFIVSSALFVILLFHPLQQGINTINHYKMQSTNNIIHVAAQTARTEGFFTTQIIEDMKTDLKKALYINDSDIRINVTTTPKYRLNQFDEREYIEYEIGIPIDNIIVMNGFLGITDAENEFEYTLKGTVPSELLE
jgi:hypothetical protein